MKLRFALLQRSQQRTRGAETIEVAIALPLVLLVIFAGCEYGWALLRTIQTDHAAREGARVAALHGVSALEVQQRVQSTLDDAGIAGATVVLQPSDPSSVPVGTPVTVRVNVPYRQNKLLGLASFMPLPEELNGHASMVKEPDP